MPPRLVSSLLLALPTLCAVVFAADPAPVYTTASASVDERVRDLLGRMTLEEKVGQLVQYSSRDDMTGPASQAELAPLIKAGGIGSLLNIKGAAETRKWQTLAVESTRLHIPLLFGLDVIHGFRTIFPIPLATAASWDLDLIERSERVAATEAAAAGIHWTFAPMVDIARDPRWGRIAEGAGEDPYLGSAIARARVRGFQTGHLGTPDTVLACVKHFAAYGAAQAGRDYFTTDVTERVLRDVYLPPFKAAAEAGAATFMAAFNDLDGTPCSANAFLMNKVLRQEWGFKGFVVSDWQGILEMTLHGNAADLREASRQAFLAGLDMDMEGQGYEKHMAELVKSGAVPMSRLDAAVGAILAAKFRLGLFDDPYRYCDEAREKAEILSRAHLEAARDAARRSCVLLQNNGILPLRTSDLTVALVGPLADSGVDQIGSWAGEGEGTEAVTLRAALSEVFPGRKLRYAQGCATTGAERSGFTQAREAAAGADVVVLALGEAESQSGETTSRTNLDLSGPQLDLLREVHAAGKPIVLVLMAGRPLMLEQVAPLADAILVAWHPGTMGGPAVADVLTGAYNPSGKLPVTWPRSVGQIPIFYAHKNSGRPQPLHAGDPFYSRYIDSPNTPLYPFGYGLSYTRFAIDGLRLSAPVLTPGGAPLTVTARVRNLGKVAGEEVVQLYVHDRVGSVTRPVRELKGFRKVALAPGEERDVAFELTSADLAFWRSDMTFGAEPGAFEVFVGDDATARLSGSFTLAGK
jgi:beta-glucosidase